jgi:hypothetical protein
MGSSTANRSQEYNKKLFVVEIIGAEIITAGYIIEKQNKQWPQILRHACDTQLKTQ